MLFSCADFCIFSHTHLFLSFLGQYVRANISATAPVYQPRFLSCSARCFSTCCSCVAVRGSLCCQPRLPSFFFSLKNSASTVFTILIASLPCHWLSLRCWVRHALCPDSVTCLVRRLMRLCPRTSSIDSNIFEWKKHFSLLHARSCRPCFLRGYEAPLICPDVAPAHDYLLGS